VGVARLPDAMAMGEGGGGRPGALDWAAPCARPGSCDCFAAPGCAALVGVIESHEDKKKEMWGQVET
jgi:hypothetical protein